MADAGKYETRSTAAWLLGRIDSQECVDSLTCLLKDDHPQVRSRALRSLLEVHRAKAQLPETVAAQAASPDPTEKAIEPAATLEQNPESIIQLRLDGTRFNVR
jgi:HEAT repeat protein